MHGNRLVRGMEVVGRGRARIAPKDRGGRDRERERRKYWRKRAKASR